MNSKQLYRLACRRGHRLLGMYLMLSAWIKRVDCVILLRPDLLPFLGLERMKIKRIDWPKKDVRNLFPHVENLAETKTGTYLSLYLSRVPFPEDLFARPMSDEDRMEKMNAMGLRTAIVSIPQEGEIVSVLACAIHGLHPFKPLD